MCTDRTIWNRRQFIKNHLGDSKLDLDKWLDELQNKPPKRKETEEEKEYKKAKNGGETMAQHN